MHRLQRYYDILDGIEAERAHEEAYYRSLSKSRKISERIDSGIVWYPVQVNKKHYTVGELVEIEIEQSKANNQAHKFKTGMGCELFSQGEQEVRFKGVVSYIRRQKMGIIFNSSVFDKSSIPEYGNLGVELVYDERPYRVMKASIEDLLKAKESAHQALKDGIVEHSDFSDLHFNATFDYQLPPEINFSQKKAIENCLQANHMAIIHGPPGTGKTTTICALARTLIQKEKQILVCAPSNNAVDLLARKLDTAGLNVLRLGNVSRIGDSIAHLSLEEKASRHKEWGHIKKVKIEAEEARRQASTFKRKFGAQEARNRNDLYRESRELRRWAKDLEDRLSQQIVEEAHIIATTLIGASNPTLDGIQFETVIIDEASQAMEAECWNAILKARRVILAGDHLQLPPTVKSKVAEEKGLNITLLDLLAHQIRFTHRLGVQYRMNEAILDFPNTQFYNGSLISFDTNRHWKIEQDDHPLTWIDTSGCGFDEKQHSENRSRWNEGEYFILREHLLAHKELYEHPTSIGIIAPYAQQVRYIRTALEEEEALHEFDMEVNSIDGFQGQEKDVIYLSLVRSNDMGQIGFLSDTRRLNVALTRAKKKLVIIGDIATVSSDATFLKLVEHIESKGYYQSAWEYMS